MVREHLSERLVEAGGQLLAMTDTLGMQAQGAMWVFDHELDEWRYYFVTSLVDSAGRRKTYRLLLDAFEKLGLPSDMVAEDVYLGSPSDPLFQLISSAVHKEGSGVAEFRDCSFNGVLFDGFMYRSVRDMPSAVQAERIEKVFTKRVKDLSRQRRHTSASTSA